MMYELRIYKILPGRMPNIRERFANVTSKLFEKHGIDVVGYWDTVVGESDEFIYMVRFKDLAERQAKFAAFMQDPEWQEAKSASEADGPIVANVINKILAPTPFSPTQ